MPIAKVNSLWDPPEQAGELKKQHHARKSWASRYFVLKDSALFYFKTRQEASKRKLYGCIPLENAKIEVEAATGATATTKQSGQPLHFITITLHTSHALTCQHPFYVLAAPSAEIQMAWVNALWQAAIPRASLIQHLQTAGRLADVVAAYAQQVAACYPCADAAVLSTGGRAKLNAAVNVGTLASMLRQNVTSQSSQDLRALPVMLQDPVAAAHVLARTASGNVASAAAGRVVASEPLPEIGASTPTPGASLRTPSASAAKSHLGPAASSTVPVAVAAGSAATHASAAAQQREQQLKPAVADADAADKVGHPADNGANKDALPTGAKLPQTSSAPAKKTVDSRPAAILVK